MYLSRGQASASHACRTPLCLLSTPVCHLFIRPILRKSLHWETVGTSSEQNETPPPPSMELMFWEEESRKVIRR